MNVSNPIGPSAWISRRIASAAAVCTGRSMAATCEDGRPMDERPIRRAASAVCVRPAPSGFEVLVVQRSAASRFLPGYVAFPGGAVDVDDEARAERWFGDVADAPRAAAVRELTEEVGLTPTAAGLVPAAGLPPARAGPPPTEQTSPPWPWAAPPGLPRPLAA